jgi:hypothetical protein
VKRHISTIVLVLAAMVLGVWLWIDRDRVTETEKRRRENSVFPAWRRDELSRVEIAKDEETIALERDVATDSAWRLTSPRQERADQQAVERLLTTLEFAGVARNASEGAELGLSPPLVSGSLTMGGLVYRFALGGPSPRPEGSSYFRIDDHAPIVVSKELTDALLRGVDAYRDRTVVPYLSLELARFQVRSPEGSFTLEHMADRSFRVADVGVMASREALDRVWGALGDMRAEAFLKEADAERLTKTPALTIVMTPKDPGKPAAELVVGAQCPGHPDDVVVLRRSPSRIAACAPRGALEALRAQPADLVASQPFFLRADEIEELRLDRLVGDAGALPFVSKDAPEVIEIARKGTGWRARAPFDRDLSPEEADAASELVNRIARSAADRVVRGSTEPFVAVARARVRSGDHEEVVEIGAAEAEARVPLRRLADGARLDLGPSVARRLVPRATSLRPRALLPGEEAPRTPRRVLLRCGAPQELVDQGAGFRLVDPPGYETDGSILQLVEGITRGRVDAWVSDADDATFGLPGEGCRVVLTFEDKNAPVTVTFGAFGERGVYGTVTGTPHVFVAPKALRELAGTIFVSRAALRVEPAQIESVRVRVAGRPVPADPSVLRDAVGALYAADVVAFGTRAMPATGSSLEIEVVRSEGGPPFRITCRGSAGEDRRACTASGVSATFAVAEARLSPFLGEADAGAQEPEDGGEVARDGGPR